MDIQTRLKHVYKPTPEAKRPCPYGPCHLRQPTKVFSHFFIHEEDPEICPNPMDPLDGHWSMYFDSSVIGWSVLIFDISIHVISVILFPDEKWDQAVNLYREGKLTGFLINYASKLKLRP